MKSHIQVKVSTLAFEARYIRSKELKWKERARIARQKQQILSDPEKQQLSIKSQTHAESNFWSLRGHRMGLRHEARHTHLAYGFMLGHPYNVMEDISFVVPDWTKIEDMVKRFGGIDQRNAMQTFSEWKSDAENHWKASRKQWLEKQQARTPPQQREPRQKRTLAQWEAMVKQWRDLPPSSEMLKD